MQCKTGTLRQVYCMSLFYLKNWSNSPNVCSWFTPNVSCSDHEAFYINLKNPDWSWIWWSGLIVNAKIVEGVDFCGYRRDWRTVNLHVISALKDNFISLLRSLEPWAKIGGIAMFWSSDIWIRVWGGFYYLSNVCNADTNVWGN